MKPILAIAAAASLALLAACEQKPSEQTTGPGAQDQAAAPQQEQPATGAPGAASFSQLDTDGNGKISKSEAQAMPRLEQDFQQADRNQDGSVDQSEFAQFETGGGNTGMAPSGQAPTEQPPAGQPSPGMESPPAGQQPAPSGTQQ